MKNKINIAIRALFLPITIIIVIHEITCEYIEDNAPDWSANASDRRCHLLDFLNKHFPVSGVQ